MYEFGTPFKVTYPPWYNPSYWYEGMKLTVDPRAQLSVVARNTKSLLIFLANSTGPVTPKQPIYYVIDDDRTVGCLLTLCFVIVLANLGRVSVFRGIAELWFVLLPVAAVLGAYASLVFEGRYIPAYVVVLWMVLFRSIAIPHSKESKRIFTAVLVSAAAIAAITVATGTGRAVFGAARYFVDGKTEAPFWQSGYTNWKVAKYLHNAGLHAGDPVGAVGWTYRAFWARMARVHIIAEVPAEGATAFWSSDTVKRAIVMQLFKDVGAKAVVAKAGYINKQQQHVWDLNGLPGEPSPLIPIIPITLQNPTSPSGPVPVNWRHIADTDYYVYLFQTSGE